jgi:hypothetical protein
VLEGGREGMEGSAAICPESSAEVGWGGERSPPAAAGSAAAETPGPP